MPPSGLPSPGMPEPPVDFENIFFAIYRFISDPAGFFSTGGTGALVNALQLMLSFATFFFLIVTITLVFKRVQLMQLEREQVSYIPSVHAAHGRNPRWELVVEYVNSKNPSDWRIAIMEADNMLFEMLRSVGYPGDSVGEVLKSIEPSDFNALDDAWKAHKVRNMIAHEGARYKMEQREARRVITLYEKVFHEFNYI